MGDQTGHAEDAAKNLDGKSGKSLCRISTSYLKRRANERVRKRWRVATSWSRTKGNGRVQRTEKGYPRAKEQGRRRWGIGAKERGRPAPREEEGSGYGVREASERSGNASVRGLLGMETFTQAGLEYKGWNDQGGGLEQRLGSVMDCAGGSESLQWIGNRGAPQGLGLGLVE